MARPLRLEFPGAVYHVTLRGNARQAIFRESFLGVLSSVVARLNLLREPLRGKDFLKEVPRGQRYAARPAPVNSFGMIAAGILSSLCLKSEFLKAKIR
jgi:hypothetical protein